MVAPTCRKGEKILGMNHLGCLVLIALSALVGGHPLAPGPVSGLPFALSDLVFEMSLGLSQGARVLPAFFAAASVMLLSSPDMLQSAM